MKNIRSILALFFFTLFFQSAFAQVDPNAFGYYTDALRFSRTTKGGTVRFQTLGGANTSLGGDISSAHTNPAGLGFSRSSQFSLTPGLNFNSTTTNLFNSQTEDSRLNVNFEHAGVLFSNAKNTAGPKKGGSFAISVTRINDFQRNLRYRGVNSDNSIVDSFLEQSEALRSWGYFDDQGDAIFDINALAYYAYLINPDFEANEADPNNPQDYYLSFLPFVDTEQSELISTRGGQYQWDFAYGGNYDDKIYYGASIGIQTIRYDETKEYAEFPLEESPLSALFFNDQLSVTGTGINLTLGMIYRLNDVVRFGVSGTTPTAIRLSEIYRADLTAEYNNFAYRPADYILENDALREDFEGEEVLLRNEFYSTIDLEAEYTLITPFRVSAGVSFFAGKIGFLTADIEYIGYRNTWLTGGTEFGIDFEGDNNTIDNLYSGAYNLKLGGELRLGKVRLRAGGAYFDDPYNLDNSDFDRSALQLSGGIGMRDRNYYFDFGIISTMTNDLYSPYTLSAGTQPTVEVDNSRTRALLSFGVFF